MLRVNHVMLRLMVSPVTREVFPPQAQVLLSKVAKQQQFHSRYWFTAAQLRRTLGGSLKPDSVSTCVTLRIEHVVPFSTLPESVQVDILDHHPPHFDKGVGILTERFKWNVCLSRRLLSRLQPKRVAEDESIEVREMFVDASFVPSLLAAAAASNGAVSPVEDVSEQQDAASRLVLESAIDIRAESTIHLYNADQLVDPSCGKPPAGLVIDAVTGRRLPLPAHHILLAAQVLRGYTSPFWISEAQALRLGLRFLHQQQPPLPDNSDDVPTTVDTHHRFNKKQNKGPLLESGIDVPTMSGAVVRLADLADLDEPLYKELLFAFESSHRTPQGASNSIFMFTIAGWEKMRSIRVTKGLMALGDGVSSVLTAGLERSGAPSADETLSEQPYPYLFVNLHDVAIVLPHRQLDVDALLATHFERLDVHLTNSSPERSMEQQKQCRLFVDLDIVTRRRFFNIAAFEKPHLIAPVHRPTAIVGGRIICRRDESQLRTVALERMFSSPLWLTVAQARALGVGIRHEEVGRGVVLHRHGLSQRGVMSGQTGFYHISDVEDPKHILSLYPTDPNAKRHRVLDGRWRPLQGQPHRAALDKRLSVIRNTQQQPSTLSTPEVEDSRSPFSVSPATPLWVSENEVLMSGLTIKVTATRLVFNYSNSGVVEVAADSGATATAADDEEEIPEEEFDDDLDATAASKRSPATHATEKDPKKKASRSSIRTSAVLYNSQQTTDPVRAICLAPFYLRPQAMPPAKGH